jgi:hypothetical protein
MTPRTTDTEPVLFQIWYRAPAKGSRWVKAGRASTYAEAVAVIGGKGDWHIAPLHNPDLAGDGLFVNESQPAEPTT